MSIKNYGLIIALLLSINSKASSEENLENSVPPIQYPEKKRDEMQVRKEIKNSFIKSEDLNSNYPQLNSLNQIPSNEGKKNSLLENNESIKKGSEPITDLKGQKTFDELIGQNISKKKNEASKKNMNVTLKESEQPSRQSELWKVFLISTIFISVLALIGYLLTKIRKKGFLFSNNKNEKVMDIVSTLSISPKRQVMILKIRDQEIVVSNTEAGIQFLTDISAANSGRNIQERKQYQISDKFLLPKNNEKSLTEKTEIQQVQVEKINDKKSDILLRALKSINSNSVGTKKQPVSDANKTESFPKYLANQFENEGKKEVKKKDEEVDSVENVTNLIREKLRSMKPLN
ncbi:flagellar biosynthetic protein FliO [Pigmentibacter sp. JX0631]|uniref:flagellar biosynthetic protein FliO n=1 Tax=Pigmentibacter sp. JX0631 TaxID=2976982 RepID=UPI0024689CB5|nr:flagellar biosynthetic protein FliO [Pigmentibacter sp. JX0631]WGL58682.1 flagellar biosynthetic protein FliO [Pigmentibacter sp. JX0631]